MRLNAAGNSHIPLTVANSWKSCARRASPDADFRQMRNGYGASRILGQRSACLWAWIGRTGVEAAPRLGVSGEREVMQQLISKRDRPNAHHGAGLGVILGLALSACAFDTCGEDLQASATSSDAVLVATAVVRNCGATTPYSSIVSIGDQSRVVAGRARPVVCCPGAIRSGAYLARASCPAHSLLGLQPERCTSPSECHWRCADRVRVGIRGNAAVAPTRLTLGPSG